MKSSYELAMERLEKDDPSSPVELTDRQKAALEDLNQSYKAKIAEREVFLRGKIDVARSKGASGEVESLERELREEKRRLENERESEKDKIRRARAKVAKEA